MRWLICLVAVAAVIGCRSTQAAEHEGNLGDSTDSVRNEVPNTRAGGPAKYPGGVGLSGGQSGTGTTSGASTGY